MRISVEAINKFIFAIVSTFLYVEKFVKLKFKKSISEAQNKLISESFPVYKTQNMCSKIVMGWHR